MNKQVEWVAGPEADPDAGLVADEDLPLGDRVSMAYKGTVITGGRGRGIVIATGMQTELGTIATLLGSIEDGKTPLQKRLAGFGKRIALVALAICGIVLVAGLMRGEPPMQMFLVAISLAVAAIPEALPAVVTVSLALGARRMVRSKALVKRLSAVETLGSVTYICADKTGTLTQNRMEVVSIHLNGQILQGTGNLPENKAGNLLLSAMALNNDSVLGEKGEAIGDPTELALLAASEQAGFGKQDLEAKLPRVAEVPFDSSRKRMTTIHRQNGGLVAFLKGAPEAVLSRCTTRLRAGDAGETLQPIQRESLLEQAEAMASSGLRVLAFGFRELPSNVLPAELESVEQEITFLGLVGLADPVRPEARQAVQDCRDAGIVPVMITGDHPSTARTIAEQTGIASPGDRLLTGPELARMSELDFQDQARRVRIYARVKPEQKIQIVKALQKNGEVVAMTGDGVNDAPALKQAEIGVAMGKVGTDVAREAAHLVLLDDNFATIVAAVREGRHIFDNIRKFVRFVMASNSAEILTIFVAPFLGLPIPLLPLHILWTNLVTDGLPGIALAMEPEEKSLMSRPPRPPRESLFTHGQWQHMLWVGILIAGLSIFAQAYAFRSGSPHWQTMVFTVLTLSQMAHVLAVRSERESLIRLGLFSNPQLLGAVFLTFRLQMGCIYLPPMQAILHTHALTAGELILCLSLSGSVWVEVEIEKWMFRRGWIYRNNSGQRAVL